MSRKLSRSRYQHEKVIAGAIQAKGCDGQRAQRGRAAVHNAGPGLEEDAGGAGGDVGAALEQPQDRLHVPPHNHNVQRLPRSRRRGAA